MMAQKSTFGASGNYATSEQTWENGLKNFLYNQILPMAEPDPGRRRKLVDKCLHKNFDPMTKWKIAFTHESYNPNVGENYEELENYGDTVMKKIFTKYLMQKYPGINRAELSEMSHHYMSKPLQSPIALELGLHDWVRTPIDKNTHLFEDLLESFFGALSEVGDQVFAVGAGDSLCTTLLVNIYKDKQLDLNVLKGHAKTQVKNIFEKLNWVDKKKKKDTFSKADMMKSLENQIKNLTDRMRWLSGTPDALKTINSELKSITDRLNLIDSKDNKSDVIKEIEQWSPDESGTGGTLTLKFTPEALKFLSQAGLNLNSDIMVTQQASTKKLAMSLAYPKVLELLNSIGITDEYVEAYKYKNEFQDPEVAIYYPTAVQRLTKEGYSDMYFKLPRIGNKGCYVQLIGVLPDGRLNVIQTVTTSSIQEGKREAVRRYASGN